VKAPVLLSLALAVVCGVAVNAQAQEAKSNLVAEKLGAGGFNIGADFWSFATT
jgi:hypothetical protein